MIVYLNGEFLPAEQAHVSVLDRGFIFGDGVYEVIPAYNGKLFRLEQHLARLKSNLGATRLAVSMSDSELADVLAELVKKNLDDNIDPGVAPDVPLGIYLQVTRGVAPRDHAMPENTQATVFAMCNPVPPVAPSLLKKGASAITLEDSRWKNCHLKTTSLLPNILLKQLAVDEGAVEAILIRDGEAFEGTASNVFIVHDGVIITPPKGPYLLPGITRDLVLELAAINNMKFEERAIKEAELHEADEIWMTSSTKEIIPVSILDGKNIGGGLPGPIWQTMCELYKNYKRTI